MHYWGGKNAFLFAFSMCQIWHTMLELDAALGVEACALTLVALSDLLGTGHDPFVRP